VAFLPFLKTVDKRKQACQYFQVNLILSVLYSETISPFLIMCWRHQGRWNGVARGVHLPPAFWKGGNGGTSALT